MVIWSAILLLSILVIFILPVFRMFKPSVVNREADEEMQRRIGLGLNSVKNSTGKIMKNSGSITKRGLAIVYKKSLFSLQNSQVRNLVNGKGILKKNDTSSSFLRDVKEHKDKVREELKNSENEGIVESDNS